MIFPLLPLTSQQTNSHHPLHLLDDSLTSKSTDSYPTAKRMGNFASTESSIDNIRGQSTADKIEQLQQGECCGTGCLLTPQSGEDRDGEATVSSTPRNTVGQSHEHSTKKPGKLEDAVYRVLFGENYSRKEARFVIAAGAILAFNNGMFSGVTVSGFLTPNSPGESVAGITGKYTESA